MIRSAAQRKAMFANMNSMSNRDNEFAFNIGELFHAGMPILNLGYDIFSDAFQGLPILWTRSPLESEILGTRYRVPPVLAEDIWRSKVGDIFDY